jgi:pantoate kinase
MEGSGRIDIRINGREATALVTRTATEILLARRPVDVVIETTLDLSASAGFGMSAAGALSSAFALAEVLELTEEEAFAAAHRAELTNRTGLGDVPALTKGGLTFRKREGLPPYGRVDRLAERLDIVAGVVGEGMRTANVLADEVLRKKIVEVGRECYRSLCLDPTVDNFFRVSRHFTEQSGLATDRVRSALSDVDRYGRGSMIMLGNSVFATGDLDAIDSVLRAYGPTYRLSLDVQGPRVLEIEY